MGVAKVHPNLLTLSALSLGLFFSTVQGAQARCWSPISYCATDSVQAGPSIALQVPTPATRRAKAPRENTLGYTVSTKGRVQSFANAKAKTVERLDQPVLIMRKGADGEIGDVAIGLGNNGSFTMDVRKNFLNISYIWDF